MTGRAKFFYRRKPVRSPRNKAVIARNNTGITKAAKFALLSPDCPQNRQLDFDAFGGAYLL